MAKRIGGNLILSVCGLAGFLVGCSLFSTQPDTTVQQPGGFRATAAMTSNSMSLPVEIADDIARITEEGAIERTTASDQSNPRVSTEDSSVTNINTTTADAKPQTSEDSFEPTKGKRKGRNGRNQKYVVKRGDTLMKIAFEKYGDLLRWKDVYEANRQLLKSYNRLTIGSVLVIQGVQYVVIEKNGEPYLIRRHDTLAKISNKVYGAPGQWRDIWRNNPQMIKNPNKIYAGFTLYYQPKGKLRPELNVRQPSSKESL